jgi:predicted esterase YcpF (UPF0227 family)
VNALVYLHGFNSSPGSIKGRLIMQHVAGLPDAPELLVPRLPFAPRAAMDKMERMLSALDTAQTTLVGSSLGGYYATWLAERFGTRAVLINPAMRAWEDLRRYLGPNRNLYTGEVYELTETHVEELAALRVMAITRPERYWLLVQTGDEVLDHREAVAFFAGARQTVIEGGDHGFRHFEAHLEGILRFADGRP